MPFKDNDPSNDWIQPDWLQINPWETPREFAKREKEAFISDVMGLGLGKTRGQGDELYRIHKMAEEAHPKSAPQPQEKLEPALRYDGDKPRLDLIPPEFLLALGQHFGQGAKKYSERNWEKGMSWSRCYASAQRHMLAFWQGEELDPETGTPHVIAAAWNMCALHWYGLYRRTFDDRGVTKSDKATDEAFEKAKTQQATSMLNPMRQTRAAQDWEV